MGNTSHEDLSEKDDLSKYLVERLRQLEERNSKLRDQNRRVETEKRYVETQKMKFEREVRVLRSELERLKSPPLVVGSILEVIDEDKVVIKSTTGPKFVVNVSQFIEDQQLRPGNQVSLNQQSLAIVDVLPTPKDPAVHGMEIIETPTSGYDVIGGLDEQIQELRETVELPLIKPQLFEKVGIDPPNGIMLHGPPGTGKTLMAKAVAKQTDATFIRIVGSELVQKYIGEGARLVRELFQMAEEKSPSIVFIDELDAIGAKRQESASSGDREVQRTLMQLLSEMDGFDPRGDVKILAATNRSDILDPALLRPGRFDRIIHVPLPTYEARIEIFKIHTRKMNLAEEVDFEFLASVTDGCSGADIRAMAIEAGMFAIRDEREQVTMTDFKEAAAKVMEKGEPRDTLAEKEDGMMFA